MSQPKVVVISLDGATFTLLKPWMEKGDLPHLQHIAVNGVSGFLHSSIPPVTYPAFQCFMTGKNPGKHGVAGFLRQPKGSYGWMPVDSTTCDGLTLWELLSAAGKRVAVVNVPATYPPHKINGVMIGGSITPNQMGPDFVHPQELLAELQQELGDYPVKTKIHAALAQLYPEQYLQAYVNECRAILAYRLRVASRVLERYDVDFLMLHVTETDHIQHFLWHWLDATHPEHSSQAASRHAGEILGYYRYLDGCIGELAEQAGAEATVMVFSDHGFGPLRRWINVNAWLLREGYIRIKSNIASRLKYFLWRKGWAPDTLVAPSRKLLNLKAVRQILVRRLGTRPASEARRRLRGGAFRRASRLFLSFADIDWTRTRAYALTGVGQIKINLVGREPQGIVQPGHQYEALREELMTKLRDLTDPETGKRLKAQIFSREEIYHGPHLDELPDITFLPFEAGYQAREAPDVFVTRRVFPEAQSPLTGCHRAHGVLLARGKAIRRKVWVEGADIMDLAPTILYLLGCPVPRDMDGRVLTELFTEAFLQTSPVAYADPVATSPRAGAELSPQEEETILKNLKDLGYIA